MEQRTLLHCSSQCSRNHSAHMYPCILRGSEMIETEPIYSTIMWTLLAVLLMVAEDHLLYITDVIFFLVLPGETVLYCTYSNIIVFASDLAAICFLCSTRQKQSAVSPPLLLLSTCSNKFSSVYSY